MLTYFLLAIAASFVAIRFFVLYAHKKRYLSDRDTDQLFLTMLNEEKEPDEKETGRPLYR
ncbi:hypothetical protein ACTID9_08875 [Brevibacillus fluminis]|uniref:hypothetical protein n=1 Tax=Brevibacillus fluminis TaxID=511487 RepID=UPI003F89B1A9